MPFPTFMSFPKFMPVPMEAQTDESWDWINCGKYTVYTVLYVIACAVIFPKRRPSVTEILPAYYHLLTS